jgi:Fic family protein
MPLSPKPKQKSIEERTAEAEERLQRQDDAFRAAYQARFDMSWIYHDSALEGSVYNELELRTALDPEATIVPESSLQPICEEIRRHREAIHYCREMAMKKRQPVTVDTFKKIYLILHPEEGDLKTVKYRKDIPQHRLYFHEYGAPDKIATKVRQAIDWLNDPETRKGRSPLRMAARVHYDLIRVFPFPQNSGKTARLFMNLLLMRAGYPPAIIHSTERQRYYEALKGSAITINAMVLEALDNALARPRPARSSPEERSVSSRRSTQAGQKTTRADADLASALLVCSPKMDLRRLEQPPEGDCPAGQECHLFRMSMA